MRRPPLSPVRSRARSFVVCLRRPAQSSAQDDAVQLARRCGRPTFSSRTSRATASGSRSSGSPQPPPPAIRWWKTAPAPIPSRTSAAAAVVPAPSETMVRGGAALAPPPARPYGRCFCRSERTCRLVSGASARHAARSRGRRGSGRRRPSRGRARSARSGSATPSRRPRPGCSPRVAHGFESPSLPSLTGRPPHVPTTSSLVDERARRRPSPENIASVFPPSPAAGTRSGISCASAPLTTSRSGTP